MKLIPARCPSCGADIEVNKSNETTKCKYCETRIFIDDAIAKYKVEIQNMPTANSYLKVGTRNLNSRDFKKAHEQLEKALEIDPDNAEIIVKESLAKVLQKEITESNLTKILSAFKDAKEFCSKDTLDDLIMYSIELLEPNRNTVAGVISSSPRKEILTAMLYKYKFFINFYERLFRNYASKDSTKKELIFKMFSTIQCYLNGGTYSEYNQQGFLKRYTYRIPADEVEQLNRKKTLYEDELAKIDDEFRINLEKRREKERAVVPIQKNNKEFKIEFTKGVLTADLILSILGWSFLFLLVCIFLTYGDYISSVFVILSIIFCTPFMLFNLIPWVRSLPQTAKYTIIIIKYFIAFILFFMALALQNPNGYTDETFTDGEKIIEVTYDYIIETSGEEKEKNFYEAYFRNREETLLKTREKTYKYSETTDELCLFVNEKCTETYYKKSSE